MSSELNSNPAENSQPSTVYSFAPFGYEGSVVSVEVDKRRGIPAVDMVGLADGSIKESRERMKSAIEKSGYEFPAERVLISLSPADLKKEGPGYDLPLALAVLGEGKSNEPVFAMGELGLDGKVRPVRAMQAALQSAREAGIKNFIIPEGNRKELESFRFNEDEKVKFASSLREAVESDYEYANKFFPSQSRSDSYIAFSTPLPEERELSELMERFDGKYKSLRALEIAAAGKHNILAVGEPGCGKTVLMRNILPLITPDMTESEARTTGRIHSIAGLGDYINKYEPEFRSPHQTASIEGICGGGPNCRPGEISLAHNGVLFLDEAAEFRTTVLQMLRVPMETGNITLARGGRSTIYPANFQLAAATNPCPCGFAGSGSHICLCSDRAIDMYWKKFSSPLLDRIEIQTKVESNADPNDTRKTTIEEMRGRVAAAMKIQRERGAYNSKLSPAQIKDLCALSEADEKKFGKFAEENGLTPRQESTILKVALTIANMDGRERIATQDLAEACELTSPASPLENKRKPFVTVSNAARESAGEEISKQPSKEENTMANSQTTQAAAKAASNPGKTFDAKVSEKESSGLAVPFFNAKLIKEAIENGTAPFLPDKNGNINAAPLYNANTGYCLDAKDLIPLQVLHRNSAEKGFSTIVATRQSIEKAETNVKQGEKGFFYNYKREDGTIGTSKFFFPEQTENPEKVIENAAKKIAAAREKNGRTYSPKNALSITSANPEEYLASYIAACKTKSPLKCDLAVAEEFKKGFVAVLDNQMHTYNGRPTKNFNAEIGKLNTLLFEADKKSTAIAKQIDNENRPKQQQTMQKKQNMEITF